MQHRGYNIFMWRFLGCSLLHVVHILQKHVPWWKKAEHKKKCFERITQTCLIFCIAMCKMFYCLFFHKKLLALYLWEYTFCSELCNFWLRTISLSPLENTYLHLRCAEFLQESRHSFGLNLRHTVSNMKYKKEMWRRDWNINMARKCHLPMWERFVTFVRYI